MAAYASLVSLMNIIDQIQSHPRPPISLDNKQVRSLTENVTFFLEFLEGCSQVCYSTEEDALEMQIADAAYAAEDIIETHIVDQIFPRSRSHGKRISLFKFFWRLTKAASDANEISFIEFYQALQKVIKDMDSIKRKVMVIKEKIEVQDQLQRNSARAGSLRSSSTAQNIIVGFDDVLIEIMDKLTGQQSSRQIIPIVGMGGIGKTTLARMIYQNQVVVQHFDILAWVTISQEYRMREILFELLEEGKESSNRMNEYELGDKLHKRLSGRRYLIIIDDIWDSEVWDQLKFFFPDNNNGSRIVLTTRLSNLASQVADSRGIDMAFLDKDNSWNLFSKIVFGEEGCPLELEKIGKKIVKNCKGLPLSLVVIGGLLAKSNSTQEYWEYIEANLNSIVNLEDSERCLKTLYLSYDQLPVHLKPCFLYLGVFSEDREVRVSELVELWVAEGFLKPISGKSLEDIAKEYLMELINRNLIFVHNMGSIGNIKCCKIHDLVKDLCLREAQKQRFYNVIRQHSPSVPQGINTQRRVVIPKSSSEEKVLHALQSVSLARSLICDSNRVLPLVNLRLLRILKTWDIGASYGGSRYFLENVFQLVNSRYLYVRTQWEYKFASSIDHLWNLQTLIVRNYYSTLTAPVEIWNMPQLRHVKFIGLYLPDPPCPNVDGRDDIILENLQTLSKISNFKCSREVIKRIPNIKKLRIHYDELDGSSSYGLNNLYRLDKLESFDCKLTVRSGTDFLQNLVFPHSLKKLTIGGSIYVHFEDVLGKIGSLPFLEKLKLMGGSFEGREWGTIEEQFPSLKFLLIDTCRDFEYWLTDSSHFPRLEHLVLKGLLELKEIPLEIGEIPTLRSIDLKFCGYSAIISAKKILEEQEELGNEYLQVRVLLLWKNESLQNLASPNFQVACRGYSRFNKNL